MGVARRLLICEEAMSYTENGYTKLEAFRELLAEAVDDGHRVLVFSQFTSLLALLRAELDGQGTPYCYLDGSMPVRARQAEVDRFQQSADLPVFLISLKAGGTGLNLTSAHHVVLYDRWWNPAVENQATDRAFRIGQTKNVEVHKFICAGTLEEKIDEIIERKVQVAENVVGTGEDWLTELSNEELKDILALREEAVGE